MRECFWINVKFLFVMYEVSFCGFLCSMKLYFEVRELEFMNLDNFVIKIILFDISCFKIFWKRYCYDNVVCNVKYLKYFIFFIFNIYWL